MRDITEIDVNFKANDDIDRDGIKFYDVLEEPFCVYGVKYENGKFRSHKSSILIYHKNNNILE